jgi:SAM-dependent methyltransferase
MKKFQIPEESERYIVFQRTAYYNNFDLALKLLKMNGVAEENIFTINIENERFPHPPKFDLIVSLLSWGYHYPVDVYIDDVSQSLSQNGKLILDVRKGTEGSYMLQKYFDNIEVISRTSKYNRLVCFN